MNALATRTDGVPALEDWRGTYDRIGQLLFDNLLEPTPENFEVCHRYLTANDSQFNNMVDRAIEQSGGLTAVAVAAIAAQRTIEISATDLSKIAEDAQEFIEQITAILTKASEDAGEYGAALEGSAADLAAGMPPFRTIENLIGLTRVMIDRTRTAEDHLRKTRGELTVLRDDLDAANRSANTDPLTGLANRRALEKRLRASIEQARREKAPLSVAICDIDHFKSFNDTHGHQIGDEVLKFIGKVLARSAGERHFAARFGGEEFMMLFEGLDAPQAQRELDRIRAEVASRELKVTATGRSLGKLSFSGGVAVLARRDSPEALVKRADAALYQAKASGRNRVCIAGEA
jgi:diguanylate cyclase